MYCPRQLSCSTLLPVEQPAQKSSQGDGYFQKVLYMDIITKSKVCEEGQRHLPSVLPCPNLTWMTNQTTDVNARYEAAACNGHHKKGACVT